jgi:hypothetical protein
VHHVKQLPPSGILQHIIGAANFGKTRGGVWIANIAVGMGFFNAVTPPASRFTPSIE